MKPAKNFKDKIKQNVQAKRSIPIPSEDFARSMTQLHHLPNEHLNKALGRIMMTPMHASQHEQMLRVLKLRASHLFRGQ